MLKLWRFLCSIRKFVSNPKKILSFSLIPENMGDEKHNFCNDPSDE